MTNYTDTDSDDGTGVLVICAIGLVGWLTWPVVLWFFGALGVYLFTLLLFGGATRTLAVPKKQRWQVAALAVCRT